MTDIHFEVQTKCGQRSDHIASVKKPSRYPCFVLNHNNDWNGKSPLARMAVPI